MSRVRISRTMGDVPRNEGGRGRDSGRMWERRDSRRPEGLAWMSWGSDMGEELCEMYWTRLINFMATESLAGGLVSSKLLAIIQNCLGFGDNN